MKEFMILCRTDNSSYCKSPKAATIQYFQKKKRPIYVCRFSILFNNNNKYSIRYVNNNCIIIVTAKHSSTAYPCDIESYSKNRGCKNRFRLS